MIRATWSSSFFIFIFHSSFLPVVLRAFEKFRQLLAQLQPHVGLLPVRAPARKAALPLHLPVRHGRPDALDLRAEELLDRLLDLDLVRAGRHLEHDRPAVFAEDRGLLGDERSPDHVRELHASTSCSRSTAARVAMTRPACMMSRAVTRFDSTNCTPSIFRTDSASFSSRLTSMSSVFGAAPSPFSSSAAAFVLTSDAARPSTTVSTPSLSFCAMAARSAPRSTLRGSAYS